MEVYDFVPKHRPPERRMSSLKPGEDPRKIQAHDHGRGTFEPMIPGQAPRPGQRLVYVDGGFDLFSSGHIAFLQSVSAIEDQLGQERGWFTPEAQSQRVKDAGEDYGPAYVVAGLHTDEVINYHKGINYPIMNLFERGLCVVQCRYIHAVVFSAPHSPTTSFLSNLPCGTPDVVYHGRVYSDTVSDAEDPYTDAKTKGLFQETPQHKWEDVNAEQIVQRILSKRHEYEERQRSKGRKAEGEEAVKRREDMERERERRAREVERQFGA